MADTAADGDPAAMTVNDAFDETQAEAAPSMEDERAGSPR
jgi:hypothetical protein